MGTRFPWFYRGRFPPGIVFRVCFWHRFCLRFWCLFGAVLGWEALKSGVKTLFIFRMPFWMRFGVVFGMILEAFWDENALRWRT